MIPTPHRPGAAGVVNTITTRVRPPAPISRGKCPLADNPASKQVCQASLSPGAERREERDRVRNNGSDLRGHRWIVTWRRWVRAWREDSEQHFAARAEVREHAPILPSERLLAVARGTGGELMAATDWALYYQSGQSWVRLGWHQVSRADWYGQRRDLTLTGLTSAVPARTVLHLAQDWGLPAVAAERVRWAKVLDQRISLNRDAGARVAACRFPGSTRLMWLVFLDHGLDPGDPRIGAELKSALAELRAVTGVEDSTGAESGITPPGFNRRWRWPARRR